MLAREGFDLKDSSRDRDLDTVRGRANNLYSDHMKYIYTCNVTLKCLCSCTPNPANNPNCSVLMSQALLHKSLHNPSIG